MRKVTSMRRGMATEFSGSTGSIIRLSFHKFVEKGDV